MEESIKIIIGTVFMIMGFPIGSLIRRLTKDELKKGQTWFRGIILVGMLGSVISLILNNDVLFFTFLFTIAVTSRSIIKQNKGRRHN